MPELAGVQHSPIVDPATSPPPHVPPPWPGYPTALEQLSLAELGWWGTRFGLDRPYLWAPSGWGEIVPLYDDLTGVDPRNIIEGRPPEPYTPPPPPARAPLYPRRGLYPRPGLYPST